MGLQTHEGVGDRTERPFFGPKSGGWGGVSGCHQSSTCRRYYRGVETKSGIGQMKSCQISVKAMGAWRDERFSGRPGAGSLPPRRPARGSRKRARLCRVARAGKRFRRQCLAAAHAAPSREPELGSDPRTHRVDRGACGASVASERRCCQPGTPTNRPARGSRKRARLCRVARAGKRFRRQCLPARHAAPKREPELCVEPHNPPGRSRGPRGLGGSITAVLPTGHADNSPRPWQYEAGPALSGCTGG